MNGEDVTRAVMDGMAAKSQMEDITAIVIVITVMLVCVALPLFLHYRTKARLAGSQADQAGVQALWDTARRMEARIGYLETVLDTEVPGWRSRSEMR